MTGNKTEKNEAFLARWSRLKNTPNATTSANTESLASETTPPAVKAVGSVPLAQSNTPTDTPPLLPDLDTLDENSDYQSFMLPNVSDVIRKKALKKLFASAIFNVRDGLDDYDDDFTFFETLPPGTMTSDLKQRLSREQAVDNDQNPTELTNTTTTEDGQEEDTSHGQLDQRQDPAADATAIEEASVHHATTDQSPVKVPNEP